MMITYLYVALGGAIGASLRYAVYQASYAWHGPGFPVATGIVNVAGSLVMGVLAAILAHRGGQHWAPFLLTGVLGGFTTFSAFSLDALTLWERGQGMGALVYIIASVVLSLGAVFVGLALGRGLMT